MSVKEIQIDGIEDMISQYKRLDKEVKKLSEMKNTLEGIVHDIFLAQASKDYPQFKKYKKDVYFRFGENTVTLTLDLNIEYPLDEEGKDIEVRTSRIQIKYLVEENEARKQEEVYINEEGDIMHKKYNLTGNKV